jgi:RNA polymerase sigma-70 factor (ECF subfamily)
MKMKTITQLSVAAAGLLMATTFTSAVEVEVSPTSIPPVVIKTVPESGASEISPGETEIRVTFSKPMRDGSWSWSTAWQDSTPEFVGSPSYDTDGKTCVARVKLEAGKTYGFWLNSQKFQNFKDQQGRPAVPYLLVFQTVGSVQPTEPEPPKIVSMTPANGATDVDPSLTEIKVTFDQPMRDGSWSMTGGGNHFPELVGDLHYDSSHTTWTAPVKLKPGWRYEFGLNSPSHQNFKNTNGVSSEPVFVAFQTSGQSTEPPEMAPKVVSITPANGATGVDPNLTEIQVVFDQPMADGSWSMCTSDTNTNFPPRSGLCHYDSTRTIWTYPVSPLRRGTTYEFSLNAGFYRGFRTTNGVSLDPVDVTFTTAQ